MNKPENAVGVLLVREGSYAVQAFLTYVLTPGAQLRAIPMIQGEVINPFALLSDTLFFAATNRLPAGVQMFSLEKEDGT